jgi:hypothetical protein
MMIQCSIGRLPIYLSPCTKWRCRGLDNIGGTAVSDHVDLARVLAHSGAWRAVVKRIVERLERRWHYRPY